MTPEEVERLARAAADAVSGLPAGGRRAMLSNAVWRAVPDKADVPAAVEVYRRAAEMIGL